MRKTSPLDTLTILSLGRKMEIVKKLANESINKEIDYHAKQTELYYENSPDEHFIQMDDTGEIMDEVASIVEPLLAEWEGHQEGYKQAMLDILDIIDPHRDMFKNKITNDKLTK